MGQLFKLLPGLLILAGMFAQTAGGERLVADALAATEQGNWCSWTARTNSPAQHAELAVVVEPVEVEDSSEDFGDSSQLAVQASLPRLPRSHAPYNAAFANRATNAGSHLSAQSCRGPPAAA